MTVQHDTSLRLSPSQAWQWEHFDEIVTIHERSRNLSVAEVAQVVGGNPFVSVYPGTPDIESVELIGATSGIIAVPKSQADIRSNAEQFVRYAIEGGNYKARAVCTILELCGQRDATVLDIGGAWGAVAAEMISLRNSSVQMATTVDRNPGNAVIAAQLLTAVGEGRLHHVLGDAPEFVPTSKYNAISILSSMLYMSRPALPSMLRILWDAILPKGVMIVFENFRKENTPASRDTHLMFTEAEMTRLLHPFGDAAYFDHKKLRVEKRPRQFWFLRKF